MAQKLHSYHQRLSALDASFLELESEAVHMHVGSVCILEPGPLATGKGGIDFARIEALVAEGVERVPRFRQRLAAMPVTGHPIWVDDPHFRLSYHVRHSSLPVPGDERQLKRLVGRLMSIKLDRDRPLWELHVVEGLEGGQLALIWKVHHCLSDGISGMDLLAAFLSPEPEAHEPNPRAEDRPSWEPRPAPEPAEVALSELRRRASLPGRVMSGLSTALEDPGAALNDASHTAKGFVDSFARAFSPASPTPLNAKIGPHRRFDWTRMELETLRNIARAHGAKINDVVLTCVAGAVRHYLREHHRAEDPWIGHLDFRAFVPVSTRRESQQGSLGNRVSMVVASLPVDEADPHERLRRVVAETRKLKTSGQAAGAEAFEELSDWTAPSLITRLSRMAAGRRIFNLVVTNVPGPGVPVYLDEARMLACYPLVPLYEDQALGIALVSYDGGLYWGFNSCWDAMVDLHDLVEDIERELEILEGL